jgi:hypothetical protein
MHGLIFGKNWAGLGVQTQIIHNSLGVDFLRLHRSAEFFWRYDSVFINVKFLITHKIVGGEK